MIKVATVCSGIGSPEQALKEIGIKHEISFACEIDKYARQTYLANFEPRLMLSDMTKESWEGKDFYSDLFIGGIPCQSFSLAGKRLGELDPRGLLFYDFYRYVQVQWPKYFIIENVKGLLSDDGGKTFRNWIQLLGRSENTHINMFNHPDSLEYNLHWKVLNTKDFGLPQNRERVFLVGVRKDQPNTFRFPTGWWLNLRLKDVLEEQVDEKYYLSDKAVSRLTNNGVGYCSDIKNGNDIASTILASDHKLARGMNILKVEDPICVAMRGRNPDNPKQRKAGQYQEQILERNSQGITNTLSTVQKDNLILEPKIEFVGGVGSVLRNKNSKGIHSRDWRHQDRVYNAEGISETISTLSTTSYYKNESRVRRLTPLECFRLQGFPDSFVKPCSDSQTYKQAGNTISVPVIKAIIKNLLITKK